MARRFGCRVAARWADGLTACRQRAWGEMRVLCLPHAFSHVRSRDSHGRRLGFSRLAARVGDCSIVGAVDRPISVRVRDAHLTRVSCRVCSLVRALIVCGSLWALVVRLALRLVYGARRVPVVA